MNKINIIVIHTQNLKNRTHYINSSLTYLKNSLENNGFISNILISNKPDEEDISKDIKEYNKRVNYDKENNKIFDNLITSLNINQISNIEKHRNALKLVKQNELNFIIEDDLIISKDYIENIEKIFTKILKENNFDILITSDFINNNNDELEIIDYKNYNNILISKSSYFINYDTAIDLKNYLYNLEYNMKVLLSKYLDENKDKKEIKILNKCTFLEGSKVGIFGTSLKNKNFLSQNSQYIELAKLVNLNIIDNTIIKNATIIYKSLENLENPEIDHMYGLIYYKSNDINKAKLYLNKAVINMKKNNNYCSKSNEILNNAINIFKLDQEYFDECIKLKSKYS